MPDDPLWFRCDGRQISQAITNLLLNAAEAIEGRNGKNLESGIIQVTLNYENNFVSIQIEDNGKGLPSQQRDRLTEPYFTTRAKGTGLGLAIVRKIMEDHKGSLQLTDSESGGACVRLQMTGELVSGDVQSIDDKTIDNPDKQS